MKMKKKIFAAAIGLAIFANAQAGQVYTPEWYGIERIGTYSSVFPQDPPLQDHVRLFVTQALVWTTPICDVGSVFIRPGDKTLLAAAHAAFASGRSVRFFTDDTLSRPYGICVLTHIEYR